MSDSLSGRILGDAAKKWGETAVRDPAIPSPRPHLRLAAVDGEPASTSDFDGIFRQHYGFARRALRALGVEPGAVDDAAQEVFLVLLRKLDTYDGRASIRAWLYGIARRVAHDFRRSRSRREQRIAAAEPPLAPVLPLAELARREAADFVDAFLRELNPEQREVFVLIDIEGLTAPEVVECTGTPLNTIYSRLRRARRRFDRAVARRQATRGEPKNG